ncbi:fimbria/pilus outer membrane usher protein [Morganella morganii]|uniref:fimbria/pilus outer membrane usher protein n=1 Tax=Morganella morganii TaxID=582 RepID=UPI000EDFE199|nr:fimbria/pilus outer membrane usher protein [Morganella morganii]QXO56461.1 fimbria/pilus outer membrane usher protein [Morganella morganii]HAE77077.1 PapC/FimD family outer membrane usher protein [Morganella sp. (in: enterobacteria)]
MKINNITQNKVVISVFVFLSVASYSVKAVEFNTDILDSVDRNNIDLSRFTNADYVMPGEYLLNIYLNDQNIFDREQVIPFYEDTETENSTKICFPAELIERLGLTEAAADSIVLWHQNQCADFSSLSGLTLKGDIADGTLYISSPQTYLEYTDPNWLPPSRWDNGISGFLLDYNVNADMSKMYQRNTSERVSVSGTAGVNISAWRIRGDYQGNYNRISSSGNAQKNFDWTRWYAYRALPRLGSALVIGENYFYSDLFDSFRYVGLSLASDERMLPPNLRGYAPEVHGIAKTNAVVTVSQQDHVIYETTVASGPFRLRDLNSAVSGRLEVRVKEQDGTEQLFYVDTANVPYLTRPGSWRYKVAAGRPSEYRYHIRGDMFTSGEFSWGMSNSWSLYGGGVFTKDFRALSAGIGRDLFMLGALSADVTQTDARLPGVDRKKGKSYRISYSKRFDNYNSEVTFAGYRFSQRDFMSMGQYLDARYGKQQPGRNKEMYTITANKNFPDARLSMYTSYTHQSFWDRGSEQRYSLSLSRYFDFMQQKNLSVNFSATRSQYDQRKNDSIFINLSIPLDNGSSLGYNAQNSGDRFSQMLSYNNNIDINNNYRLSAGGNTENRRDTKAMLNGYYTHHGDMADVSLNAAYAQDNYTSAGISVQGGVTVTHQGVALHPSAINGGTRLMVSTDGIGGVPIDGGIMHSNRFGVAVLTNMNSYYRTSTSIDLTKVDDDIDVSKSVVESVLTDGAIGYRSFELLQGEKAFSVIRTENGNYPPFGAGIFNSQGRELAIVADNGQAYITGFKSGEILDVIWSGKKQCNIQMPEDKNIPGNLLLPCRI